MPEYPLYALAGERPYLGPRKIIQCGDDAAAIKAAANWAKEQEVEIWENSRFVARLPARMSP
jgi:hypothetical protein